ncbi:hypothetical protein ACFX4N_24540 [Priestia sp. YIM B13551]|uniref:hypothetical protein n=1 Tax=Priestia sp. YIM B13551 TaxID=3366306 RepID=UPI003672CC61
MDKKTLALSLTEQQMKEKQKRYIEIHQEARRVPEFEEERFFLDDDPDVVIPEFESMRDGSLEELVIKTRLEQRPCTTYYELMNRHLEDLKKIRKEEHLLSDALMQDWHSIQVTVSTAKKGRQFDYNDFKNKFDKIKSKL